MPPLSLPKRVGRFCLSEQYCSHCLQVWVCSVASLNDALVLTHIIIAFFLSKPFGFWRCPCRQTQNHRERNCGRDCPQTQQNSCPSPHSIPSKCTYHFQNHGMLVIKDI